MSDFRSEFHSKNKSTKQESPLFPPPRAKVNARDVGLRPKIRTIGGPGMKDSPAYRAQLGFYPLYQSAEAMEFAVNAYFIRLEEEKRPPTLAGLALALGFKSTKSLKVYEDKGEDYSHIVEVARTRVEEWKNELLLKGGTQTSGVIFDLKNNHGWAEKSQSTQTVETGDTLSQLLLALQGKVLRPSLEGKSMPDTTQAIEDAEFAEYTEFTEELTDELSGKAVDEQDEDFI